MREENRRYCEAEDQRKSEDGKEKSEKILEEKTLTEETSTLRTERITYEKDPQEHSRGTRLWDQFLPKGLPVDWGFVVVLGEGIGSVPLPLVRAHFTLSSFLVVLLSEGRKRNPAIVHKTVSSSSYSRK